MTETLYDNHDTRPIELSQKGSAALRRSNFQKPDAPKSAWEKPSAVTPSVFEPVNPNNPEGTKRYETLAIGDVLRVPQPVYDEHGQTVPDAFQMTEYTVTGRQGSDHGMSVRVVDADGNEDWLEADTIAEGLEIESKIARRLVDDYGVNIHSPDARLIDNK